MIQHLVDPLRRSLLAGAAVFLPTLAVAARRVDADADPSPSAPLLAMLWDERIDPEPYLVSEKYDGVRAVWDGRLLRHRSGRTVSAPATFLRSLPDEAIDGELWLGRGRFDALSAIVRRHEPRPDEWAAVRYMAFEMPQASGSFADRADRLAALLGQRPRSPVEAAPQRHVANRDALMRLLGSVVAGGGEGLMLHLASSPARSGRSADLLKLKPHLDAEAVVCWHPGTGRNRS
ncbi:MAG TPA: DNA ligase, partial [Caldimonas sp.]|nr:DNA ligase [Caldimonas sp.]